MCSSVLTSISRAHRLSLSRFFYKPLEGYYLPLPQPSYSSVCPSRELLPLPCINQCVWVVFAGCLDIYCGCVRLAVVCVISVRVWCSWMMLECRVVVWDRVDCFISPGLVTFAGVLVFVRENDCVCVYRLTVCVYRLTACVCDGFSVCVCAVNSLSWLSEWCSVGSLSVVVCECCSNDCAVVWWFSANSFPTPVLPYSVFLLCCIIQYIGVDIGIVVLFLQFCLVAAGLFESWLYQ